MTDLLIGAGAALAGAAAVVVALRLLPAAFHRPPHVRTNYRGRELIGTAGLVLCAPLALGGLAATVLGDEGIDAAIAMVGAGGAMALLGFLDDVYGSRHAGGFVGHARELLRARVTTGSAKAVGGGIVGLVAAWGTGWRGVWILAAGTVVALSANLANLVDLRPARALKIWIPCAVALVGFGLPGGGEHVLVALGSGGIIFGRAELSERVMLGDTGAGLLGAVIGVAAVSAVGRTGLLIVLGTLAVLTVASEVVSFTRVIESVAPLRWVDELGRRP